MRPFIAAALAVCCATSTVIAEDRLPETTARLDQLVDSYTERLHALQPLLATQMGDHRFDHLLPELAGPDGRTNEKELTRWLLAGLARIDPQDLDGERLMTWRILDREAHLDLEGLAYPEQLLPVSDAPTSLPLFLPTLAEPDGVQPLATAAEHRAYLARLEAFPRWVEQAITNMQEGLRLHITMPRSSIENVLPALRDLAGTDTRDNVFFAPANHFGKAVPRQQRKELRARYDATITSAVRPAYQRLVRFLSDQYLPRCRESIGLSALPDGSRWYEHRVRAFTTSDLTPDEIFEIGVNESQRVVHAMQALIASSGYADHPEAFFRTMNGAEEQLIMDSQALSRHYSSIGGQVDRSLARLFHDRPQTPLEVRGMSVARRRAVGAPHYVPGRPGRSAPGVFYLDDARVPRPRSGSEALYLHEAVPGHHFQISLARENGSLPPYRRFLYQGAFIEGWALYAEGLGGELGLYRDPFQQFGRLRMELLRSARLIADVAIHHRGLDRAAVSALLERHALGFGRGEIDRYVSWPAQALSYKLGELKIRQLRERAEQSLGDTFDIRGFHHELLCHGAVPLWVLEECVDAWIATHHPTAAVEQSAPAGG